MKQLVNGKHLVIIQMMMMIKDMFGMKITKHGKKDK